MSERRRGPVLLDRLGNGAEGLRKVVGSNPGRAIRRLDNSLCQPSSKSAHFSNQAGPRSAVGRASDS